MRIYLLRHGIAVEHGNPDFPDDARPLTDRGRRRTRAAARGLRSLGIEPAAIWTSPLPRAAETAAIVAEVLHLAIDPPRDEPLLAPGGALPGLVEALTTYEQDEIMLVGHQPDLSRLASLLLTKKPDVVMVELRKAGVCALDVDPPVQPGGARLYGVWQAGLLRRIASER